jgi:flagellar biosynthesis protein FlhF
MNAKTYQADSMADALAIVKRDLGRDAVILHTRSFRKGGLLGFGGRSMWEITAAPNINVPRRAPQGAYVSSGLESKGAIALQEPATAQGQDDYGQAALRDRDSDAMAGEQMPAPFAHGQDARAARSHGNADASAPLEGQIGQIRSMVSALLAMQSQAHSQDMPAELVRLQMLLARQEVQEDIAQGLIDDLRQSLTGQELCDAQTLRDRLLDLITHKIATAEAPSGPATGKVIALIGPTGVGKTTTIAKLAANYKLQANKRVGLITIDTYRIAAVDQLRTYAQIIEVPLKVVLSVGELQQAIASMKDLDVILVDTAGRSQNDSMRLGQLRRFLEAMKPDETHLVISATANRASAAKVVGQFVPLGANRIIISKLDEADSFGLVLNVACAGNVPISYVTTGQGVPDDIASANSQRLAQLILEPAGADAAPRDRGEPGRAAAVQPTQDAAASGQAANDAAAAPQCSKGTTDAD